MGIDGKKANRGGPAQRRDREQLSPRREIFPYNHFFHLKMPTMNTMTVIIRIIEP